MTLEVMNRRPIAMMGLVLPMPGDMSAGGVVNDDDALPPDDDEGWDG